MHCCKLIRNCSLLLGSSSIRSTLKCNYQCKKIEFVGSKDVEIIKADSLFQAPFKYVCTSTSTFHGRLDNFNGVTVDIAQEPFHPNDFKIILQNSLTKWGEEHRRCIWFKVNIKNTSCVPMLADTGFNFHHARSDFVMMYKWLPGNAEANLPPPTHTNMGVGAMVFNKQNQILAVSEKHYDYPHLKLPGGYIEMEEDIISAAVREVKEETNIDAKFESLVTMRHTHHMMFNNSDVYIILRMSALTNDIKVSNREIKECKWIAIEDYLNHPHVHKWNRLMVTKALEHMKRGIKLDIQKKTVTFGKNVREMNVLMVEDL